MKDEELKKIVEEVIGNNDPFWNVPIYNIVKKIIDLPEGTETTISKLLDDTTNSYNKFMFEINKIVTEVCKKINIQLDKSNYKNAVVGLPYNIPFVKKSVKVLKCPNCGEKLMFLMPDGKFLSCNNCDKCYINNNGNVGNETVLPDNGNEVLY